MTMMMDDPDESTNRHWREAVLSILGGSSSSQEEPLKVKKLRKQVLLSLQQDESDKAAKKIFKRTVQTLEEEGSLKLEADGTVKLSKKRRREMEKKSKKKKKKKKERSEKDDDEQATAERAEETTTATANDDADESKPPREHSNDDSDSAKKKNRNRNAPCKGNPQGVTRLFLGNLPFAVDEASLEAFLPPGLTHVKWITDKETGKFYGSAFVEMETSASAADAVARAGQQLMGRPVKVNFAPARPGDPWPPPQRAVSGGGSGTSKRQTTGGQAGGTGRRALSAKPDGCVKLFVGNLSYDVDDESIAKFFANADAEVKAVRWLHHRDTGDFKGV